MYMGPLSSGNIFLICYDYKVLNQCYYLVTMPQVWISIHKTHPFWYLFVCLTSVIAS